MREPLHVLVVDDSENDAELLLAELRRAYEPVWVRVETEDAMRGALENERWELVITDYSLPTFSALGAIEMVERIRPELPVIVVSGTVSEDVAVETMRAGARDFLAKDRLQRLVPAVARELSEAAVRRERTAMREQLMISDRLASVGILAAGVAHEINNPLAVLVMNVEILDRDLVDLTAATASDAVLGEIRQTVGIVAEAAGRVRGIARDLKLFSRVSGDGGRATRIRRRARGARLVHTHGFARDPPSGPPREGLRRDPPVNADDGRLGQVFVNLLVNAAQAIEPGNVAYNEIRVVVVPAGHDVVHVEVRDTGAGIPPETRSRIFDPFYTSKPVGIGTGLGLAISHRIVSDLGGRIEVESDPGRGSTFRVVLPAAERPAVASLSDGPKPVDGPRPRVLVIDDEVALGRALGRLLAGTYTVDVLASARVALDRVRAGERWDAILCDLLMPYMSGMDFYGELSRVAPEQARSVVFATAGAATPDARAFLDTSTRPWIDKPFELPSLRELLDEAVASARSSA